MKVPARNIRSTKVFFIAFYFNMGLPIAMFKAGKRVEQVVILLDDFFLPSQNQHLIKFIFLSGLPSLTLPIGGLNLQLPGWFHQLFSINEDVPELGGCIF